MRLPPSRIGILLGAALVASFGLTSCSQRTDAPEHPNVLLLCIDALRANRLGLYGATSGASPHLDHLASSSVVFDRAYSVASWTKPSVPSLLTGLYPSKHGVFDSSSHGVDVLADGIPTLAEGLHSAGYRTAAFVENSHLDRRYSRLDRGFDEYLDGAGEAWHIVHRFLSWLDDGASERPFFAYLHFLDVHWPYTPEIEIPGRELSNADRAKAIEWQVDGKRWWLVRNAVKDGILSLGKEDVALLERLYDDEIYDTDGAIGRMLELLAARGVLDDTVVVVTADHGEGFLDHGRLDHGYGLYDELLRIPMILRLPGGALGGRRVADPVQIVDVAPTLLSLAGNDASALDGESLLPLAEGQPGNADRPLYFEERHGTMIQTGVRAGRYKLLRTVRPGAGGGTQEAFFDVPADLAPGSRVQAEGIYAGGRFVADEVKKIDAGDDDCEVAGPLARVDDGGRRLQVLGYQIGVSPDRVSTGEVKLIEGNHHFALSDLRPLVWVRAHGEPQARSFDATKVERVVDAEREEIEIEGLVGDFEVDGGGVVWLEICDTRVALSPDLRWKGTGEVMRRLALPRREGHGEVEETLYDTASDVREQVDLVPQNPPVLKDLRDLLHAMTQAAGEGGGGDRPTTPLDPETRERLRALGYLR